MVDRGKQFEHEIKAALEKVDYGTIDRITDPPPGFKGHQNICDFTYYAYPFYYYLECKETKGTTLNFKSKITETQWKGLLSKSGVVGVVAGILVWFFDFDITAFVDITDLEEERLLGKKSLNVADLIENKINHIEIPGIKRSILFDYDGKETHNRLQSYAHSVWGGGLYGKDRKLCSS